MTQTLQKKVNQMTNSLTTLQTLQTKANQYRVQMIIEAKCEKHSLASLLYQALLRETREKIRTELKRASQRNVVTLRNV